MNAMENNKELEQLTSDLGMIKKIVLKKQLEASQRGKWELAKKLFRLAQDVDEVSTWVDTYLDDQQREVMQPQTDKAKLAQYPKFAIEDDTLVRSGLRRDGESLYVQSIPKAHFDDIVTALRKGAGDDGTFAAVTLKNGIEHPDYQMYAVIGFLEKHQLIKNLRRGEYKVNSPHDLERDAGELWRRVKEQK